MEYIMAAILSVILLAVLLHKGAAQNCAPITDKSYSKQENEIAKLVCEFTTPTTSKVKWIDPNGQVVSTDCQSSNPRFTVKCTPVLSPTKYTLVFNASWSDRGAYGCVCESNSVNSSVIFTVKVPPATIKASCIVKDTGKTCDETSRKSSDVLQFSATVGCSSPSPTITWKDDLGSPVDTANFGGILKVDTCTGSVSGQKSVVNSFSATWSQLGKPGKLNAAAENEVGGKFVDLLIHKEPEKEDTTAVVVGAVIGVILFLVILGLVAFLIARHKRKKMNNVV
ncbi:uncharacterized protein LOC135485004 [Lineus longissimus]|uniref:uncharacterized protein LOC135485004 n=1 Tax=Lineus longissimus TaxID=88925 RepID=UPI002B4D585B